MDCRLAWAWADKLALVCMLVWEGHKMALVGHKIAWVVHMKVQGHRKTVSVELSVVAEVSVQIHQLWVQPEYLPCFLASCSAVLS